MPYPSSLFQGCFGVVMLLIPEDGPASALIWEEVPGKPQMAEVPLPEKGWGDIFSKMPFM